MWTLYDAYIDTCSQQSEKQGEKWLAEEIHTFIVLL